MQGKAKAAIAIAKAKVKVKTRKEAKEKAERDLISKIQKGIVVPTPIAGKAGRDAPELSTILESLQGMLPEPKVENVTNTIVQKIDEGDLSGMVEAMLSAKIPEIEKSLRPKVELIREDVSEEKLEGFVSKKDFDKALERIQDAITYHSGGGGRAPDVGPLANVINANKAETTITLEMLDITKLNIVHATVPNSTITLPPSSPNYIIWVEDAVVGGGNLLINKNQT